MNEVNDTGQGLMKQALPMTIQEDFLDPVFLHAAPQIIKRFCYVPQILDLIRLMPIFFPVNGTINAIKAAVRFRQDIDFKDPLALFFIRGFINEFVHQEFLLT